MQKKHLLLLACGISAVIITVLLTLLMQRPAQPIIVTMQTETVPLTEIGTASSGTVQRMNTTSLVSTVTVIQTSTSVIKTPAPDCNLNTADEAALQEVSGVGMFLAEKIIVYRETVGGFVRRSQLLEIDGIGETLAARIMERFYIPDELPEETEQPPAEIPAETEPAPAEQQAPEEIMLDINTATKEALMQLPDMTETLADDILSLRERLGGYQSLQELVLVPGMKPDYLKETLMQHLTITE